MNIYDDLTQEEFHNILDGIVDENGWDVPGVREILAEYYNNAVLDEWEETNYESVGCFSNHGRG